MEQPKIWDYVLGGSAEINNIPNDVIDESLGSPSFKALFPEITGVPIADGGIPVKRKDINALFKLIGEQIYFIQRGGTYKWDYNATYPVGAIVLHNGEYYRAIAENTSRDPSVDTNSWKPLVEVKPEDLENVQVDDGSLLSKGIVQLTNEISDDETLAVTPKAVKTLLEQLNTISAKVDATDSTVSLLTGTVSQNTSDIQNLQAKDAQIDSDIDTLRALIGDGTGVDLSAIQQQIDDIKAVNNQQDADIEELKNSSGGNYDEVIAELQASDTNQNGQIATLGSNVSEINSNIGTIENNVTDLTNNVSSIQTNVGTLQGNISSIQNDIEDLKAQSPEGLQSEITRLQKSVDNVEEDLGILVGVKGYDAEYEYDQGDLVLYGDVIYKAKSVTTGNLPTNETYFDVFDRPSANDYSSDINALNTRVGNTETRITALENSSSGSQDLTEIETRLDTAETNISSLQSTDVTLSDRITALENGSGGSSTDLTELTQRVSDAESDISTLQSDLGTVETALASKAENSAVTANASSISALDTRVTALENAPSGGGSGGTAYSIYSLDTAGETGDGVAMNDETYVTYEADGANAITGISVSGQTITININHARSLRRLRVYGSTTDLPHVLAQPSNPFIVKLKYDDASADNSYDEFKVDWILPMAQVFLSGDANGSIQGAGTEMSIKKAIWYFDSSYPELRISTTVQLEAPLIVVINF